MGRGQKQQPVSCEAKYCTCQIPKKELFVLLTFKEKATKKHKNYFFPLTKPMRRGNYIARVL